MLVTVLMDFITDILYIYVHACMYYIQTCIHISIEIIHVVTKSVEALC